MKNPARILVYGFIPYGQFRENITPRILRALPARAGLKKVVFPVRFHREQFIGAIERCKPDIVIGLGQSTRRKVEVETQATNRRRGRASAQARKISLSSPRKLETTLRLKTGRHTRRSSNAGDYVCNFSMYVMLDHIRRCGIDCRYGFLHIPHDYDVKKATRCVEEILRSC